MEFLHAIILGFLQGLTEFLPVSSSGHLVIAQTLMRFSEPVLLFDTLLHVATLAAVVLYFRYRVIRLIQAFLGLFFRRFNLVYYEQKRFLWGIIIGSVPTAAIGLFLEQWSESLFASTTLVGYSLILTSTLLLFSDKARGYRQIQSGNAFWIGVVQGIAVLPGISRSGSTIAAGLLLGVKREEVAEFSFLLSVPAILGALLLQLGDLGSVSPMEVTAYSAGMLVAFITGLFAISMMMNLVRNASLRFFALYCLVVGIFSVVWL